MSDDKENIEQEKVNKNNFLKKLCSFAFIFLFISIICCCTQIANKERFLNKNGTFEILEGAYGMAAVPLNENEIFLATEYDGKKVLPAQIYNIKEKKFKSLNSFINQERSLENAINLDDGRILIFGGTEEDSEKSAEIYNIKTNKFEKISDTNFPHNSVGVNLVKLKDGRVFIISEDRAEIFNPKTNKFDIAGKETKYYQKSVFDKKGEKIKIRTTNNIYNRKVAIALLKDGRVLILGANYDLNPNNAEIYNPKTNKFENIGSQNFPMFYRDAVTLEDGRVLVTGGTKQYYPESINPEVKKQGAIWSADKEIQDNNAEIFDPNSNKFIAIPPMNIVRQDHKSVLLSNGKVLIVHGTNDLFLKSKDTKTAELFDPKTNKFKLISSSDIGWYKFNVFPLNDNTVLFTSFYRWEIYKY